MYEIKELESMTAKELMVIAKELSIEGRSKMKKEQLINAILEDAYEAPKQLPEAHILPQTTRIDSPKDSYIDSAKVGVLVAFRVNDHKVLSGMIKEIKKDSFIVETKMGPVFNVPKGKVIWVKTGPRWPRGVYLALRGEA